MSAIRDTTQQVFTLTSFILDYCISSKTVLSKGRVRAISYLSRRRPKLNQNFFKINWIDLSYLNCLREDFFVMMLRNTRSKLMSVIYHALAVMTIHPKYLFFDTFLNQQTNLKSMFSPLSVK